MGKFLFLNIKLENSDSKSIMSWITLKSWFFNFFLDIYYNCDFFDIRLYVIFR